MRRSVSDDTSFNQKNYILFADIFVDACGFQNEIPFVSIYMLCTVFMFDSNFYSN